MNSNDLFYREVNKILLDLIYSIYQIILLLLNKKVKK